MQPVPRLASAQPFPICLSPLEMVLGGQSGTNRILVAVAAICCFLKNWKNSRTEQNGFCNSVGTSPSLQRLAGALRLRLCQLYDRIDLPQDSRWEQSWHLDSSSRREMRSLTHPFGGAWILRLYLNTRLFLNFHVQDTTIKGIIYSQLKHPQTSHFERELEQRDYFSYFTICSPEVGLLRKHSFGRDMQLRSRHTSQTETLTTPTEQQERCTRNVRDWSPRAG